MSANPEKQDYAERRSVPRSGSLVFGTSRIDLANRTLSVDGERVQIQRKPLEVLIYLVDQAPRLVSREELLRLFWSTAVNEESVTRCISTIRKLLDDSDDPPRFIETHRAQGYRFVADVAREGDTSDQGATGPRRAAPRTRTYLAAALVILSLAAAWLAFDPDPAGEMDERIDRITVLPIAVSDQQETWLQAALTDHLMQAVSSIEGITVVAAGDVDSSMQPQTAGRQLNVQALLVSCLEQVPDGSRLSAQLVATADAGLLWSSSVDSPEALSSDMQVADLARQVARRLRPMLQLQSRRPPVDPVAYRHYLEGRYYWSQRSPVGLNAAIRAFDAALVANPDYVDALVGAAESWLLLPLYGATPPNDSIPRARSLAEQALLVDPANARARAVLGVIAMQYDWDWQEAERLLKEAVALNPNDATAQQWLGEVFCYQSLAEECRRQFRTALELDPLSPVLKMQQGSVYLYSGEYETAIQRYDEAIESHPEFAMVRYAQGLAFAGLGDWQRAIAAYESAMPELGLAIVGGPMVFALARRGDVDAARAMLKRLEGLAEERYVPPSKLAIAYLGLDDRDRALSLFEAALDAHDDRLLYFATDSHTRGLVDEDGFVEIARRAGLVPARRAD